MAAGVVAAFVGCLNDRGLMMARKIRMTEDEYLDGRMNYVGYCLKCGDEAYNVEPDARKHTCDSCGAAAVYGIEDLLMTGRLDIKSASYKGAK